MFNIACMINFFISVPWPVKIKKEKCYNIEHYTIKKERISGAMCVSECWDVINSIILLASYFHSQFYAV